VGRFVSQQPEASRLTRLESALPEEHVLPDGYGVSAVGACCGVGGFIVVHPESLDTRTNDLAQSRLNIEGQGTPLLRRGPVNRRRLRPGLLPAARQLDAGRRPFNSQETAIHPEERCHVSEHYGQGASPWQFRQPPGRHAARLPVEVLPQSVDHDRNSVLHD
jgi:hypothetical protein